MAYDNVLRALSDPTRRAIYDRLRRGPQHVEKLAAGLDVTRPAVSQHLRVLTEAGLVRVRREGTRRVYSVEVRGLRELRRYLDNVWEDALASFARQAGAEGRKHGKG